MMTKVLRKKDIREKLGLSDVTIWRMERDGDFPQRIKIGPNSVGWIESEVDQWIEQRAAER